MAFLYGNLSPKNCPLFWDGMKYYYNAGVNAGRLNTTRLHDFSDFLMNNTIMTDTPSFSTRLMTRANNLFDGDTVLRVVTDPLFVTNCTTFQNAFRNCYQLEEIRFEGQLKQNVDLHYSTQLSIESVLSICYSMYSGINRQLQLSTSISTYATEYVKINSTNDGLVVCSSSDPETLGTLAQYVTGKSWVLTFI